MGVTSKRFGFALLVVAALAVSLRPSPRPKVVLTTGSQQSRLDSLTGELFKSRLIATSLTQRDSALRLAEGVTTGGGRPTIVAGGFPPGTRLGKADSVVDKLWSRIGQVDPRVSTIVLAYRDTTFDSGVYTGAVVTRRDSLVVCVAVVPAFGGDRFPPRVSEPGLSSALAPCTLLSAFGPAGAGMQAWLDTTRYVSIRSNNWLTRPRGFHEEEGPWVWYDASGLIDRGSDLMSLMSPIGVADVAVVLTPTYAYGAAGLRCIVGNEEACRRSVLHPAVASQLRAQLPADLTLSRWMAMPDSVDLGTLRPPVPTFISTMVLEFGRERFKRFWQSDRPFEQAFEESFGESLGHYTARWAREEWLASSRAKYRGNYLELGVTLRPGDLLVCAAWSLVALLIASMVARRRHV